MPKFEFAAPIVRVPEWHVLAGVSVVIAAVLLGIFFVNSSTLGTPWSHTAGSRRLRHGDYFTVWVIYDYTQQYLTVTSVIVVGAFLVCGNAGCHCRAAGGRHTNGRRRTG